MVSDAQVTMTLLAQRMHRWSQAAVPQVRSSHFNSGLHTLRKLVERMQTYLIIIACSLAPGIAEFATDEPGQIFEEASSVRELEIIAGVHDFLTSATTLFEMKTALGPYQGKPQRQA